jgi:hypothetical protein
MPPQFSRPLSSPAFSSYRKGQAGIRERNGKVRDGFGAGGGFARVFYE